MIAYGVDSKHECTDEHRDNAKDVTGSGSRDRKRRKMKQELYSNGNVVNVLCGEVPLLLNNKWPNSAHAQFSIILHIYVVFVIMVLPFTGWVSVDKAGTAMWQISETPATRLCSEGGK